MRSDSFPNQWDPSALWSYFQVSTRWQTPEETLKTPPPDNGQTCERSYLHPTKTPHQSILISTLHNESDSVLRRLRDSSVTEAENLVSARKSPGLMRRRRRHISGVCRGAEMAWDPSGQDRCLIRVWVKREKQIKWGGIKAWLCRSGTQSRDWQQLHNKVRVPDRWAVGHERARGNSVRYTPVYDAARQTWVLLIWPYL